MINAKDFCAVGDGVTDDTVYSVDPKPTLGR
jgi:hypothetical protein